ncbi:LuxR C-terminal-related transcriptional regulator [Georgenia sp. Z1344]|uniref:LuxR C-terminal-related transcriptional regulator n=1 Tax=Georgenia sp. Z1344 TaxID=3416706 RepID=UPI003CF76880
MTVTAVPLWGAELAALHDRLADVDRAGVVVVGGPGSGTTSLVGALLADGVGPASLTLQCGPALVDVPYGALAPFLTDLDAVRGPVDVLAAVQARLDGLTGRGAAGAGSRPVIVVEDCQFLDAASAFVLALLAQNREALLVATSVGLRGESGLGALVDTGLLATVTMPPMGHDQTRDLCASLAGGRPTDGAVGTVVGMTGGMPGLVVAYMASAASQGQIVRAEDEHRGGPGADLWTLLRPAPAVDERLVEVVEGMQSELTEQQQTVVTMLALAGRMPAAELRAHVGDQVEDLADTHVTRPAEGGTVELSAELYSEVLRTITPPGRGAELLARWGAAGSHADGRALRGLPARSVAWALDNGLPVADVDRVAAGYEHLAARDLAAAWFLAARSEDSSCERIVALRAEVMLAATRSDSGGADLTRLVDTTADTDLLVEALVALAMDRVCSGGAPTPVAALAEVWLECQARALRSGRPAPVVPVRVATWLSAIDRLDAPGDAARLLDTSAGLTTDPTLPPALRCVAHWVRRRLLTRAGRLVDAVEEATRAHALASADPRTRARVGGHAAAYLVESLLLVGDLAGADRVLAEQHGGSSHRWHAWAGTVQAMRGALELARGRTRLALRLLRDAGPDLDRWDPVHLTPLVRSLEAAASPLPVGAPSGRAGGLADRLRTEGGYGTTEQRLLALTIAEIVDDPDAPDPDRAPLWRRLAEAPGLADHPAVLWQALLVAAAVRDPDGDHAELLAGIHAASTRLDGRRAERVARAYDPSIADDPVRLAQVADRCRGDGDPALAADTWARVVRLHHGANDLRRRGEALRHLQDAVGALGGVPGRYVRAALDLGALTPREREIVALALEGHRSVEIARILVVSPRTVEGHLYRVFNKLGISDRAELRDVWR